MKYPITMSTLLALSLAASAQTNTFVGSGAGAKNTTGKSNTAVGPQAMPNNTTGSFNVAVGDSALLKNKKGENNIGIGVDAGANLTKDDNICIDNPGKAKDSGVVRLGRPGTHKKSYFAGKMFGDGSGLKKLKVKPTDIKGTIPGSKITASSITGSHLSDSLALPGTTTGAFSGTFTGDLAGNAATATTATTATTAESLSGSLNGGKLVDASVTAGKLAQNLTLGGTTTGSFSGTFLGDLAGTALIAQTVQNEFANVVVVTEASLGGANGYTFDGASAGLLLESNAAGGAVDGAGLFLNGNGAVLYSPGDNDILQVHDEDNMGTSVFRIKNSTDGIESVGPATFGGDVTSTGTGIFSNGTAVGGAETLRVLRGEISGSGTVYEGSGFTSSRSATGTYTITLDTPCSDLVVPVVTVFDSTVPQIATVSDNTNSSFNVHIWSIAGAKVDSVFEFVVVGPK